MEPTVGRVVLVKNADPGRYNGATEVPALVVRVWGERAPGCWTVNLRVIGDCPPDRDQWLTSRYLYDPAPIEHADGVEYAVWPQRV